MSPSGAFSVDAASIVVMVIYDQVKTSSAVKLLAHESIRYFTLNTLCQIVRSSQCCSNRRIGSFYEIDFKMLQQSSSNDRKLMLIYTFLGLSIYHTGFYQVGAVGQGYDRDVACWYRARPA